MGKTHAAKAEDERDTDVCINKGEQRKKDGALLSSPPYKIRHLDRRRALRRSGETTVFAAAMCLEHRCEVVAII
jgi:hypothetical protein